MRKGFIQKFSAFFLMFAFLLSATAIAPLSIAAQTTDDKSKKDEKKDKKDKQKQEKTASTTQTVGNKTLAVNEDPNMIGKRNINSGADKIWSWLGGSKEKEMQVGRQLALEVEQQAKLVDDEVVTEYVNRVGQNIVLHSDAKVPFTIKVIDTDEVNAFALPGGFFFVNKGLILAADNESELAGVMAHEIAHVAARHAMENQGKATAMNYGMLAGIIFGGGIISTVLQNGGGILGALGMLKFTRGAEEEADRLGVQYLYASGYDPTGMATMFEKLASQNKKKPGTIAKLFSSHPQSLDRRDASLALVARFPEKEEYVISTSEFQRVKAHLMRLSNAKAGVTSDVDDTESSKPTLKRRQPDSENTTNDPASNTPTDDQKERPQLKKRSDPSPSPSPNN
ncbi:MAG TPA: M48 family metallopeptidase [Pyrinomonadaceae bacterium]|jgi:predicted Zn-dependent protease|nr:M48 family metallopeptidase [Pyrinomonadaceae bacterium]